MEKKIKKAWNKGLHIWNGGGFKKGQTPWNKGIPSPELSERNRRNNPAKKGELSHTWKGGCIEYKKRQALIRDDYTCQICGMREVEIMEVDHIKPKSLFPELISEMNNLMTLCPNCHARKTIREKKQKYKIENYL
jgi:5-methylcytosine-specific restriction endonuclease McrA